MKPVIQLQPSMPAAEALSESIAAGFGPPIAGSFVSPPDASLGIDVEPLSRTPYGELDRIEIGANNREALTGELILRLCHLGRPLVEGREERITIIKERPESIEILSTPEPGQADNLQLHGLIKTDPQAGPQAGKDPAS